MKVEFLDGPALAYKLPALLQRSSSLDVAMAYVKIGGLQTLMKSVNSLLKRNGSFRIVFGLSSRYAITDKESAQALLNLSKQNNVIVRKWNSCGFHPKLLIFHGNPTSIVVGSANLTEPAQSTNAEANILVEDPEPEVIKNAEQFFSDYFDTAPPLKRKDVDKYERRFTQRTETTPYGTSNEDDLPSPRLRRYELESMRPNKIWKIAPGKDANCWDEWVQAIDEDGEGIVAMGWNEIGNLGNFKTKDQLREAVDKTAEEIWNKIWPRETDVNYTTKQLWAFRNEISKGDVFIVYSESRVLGIAEVEAEPEYMYEETGRISYAHRIKVKYRWYKQWPGRTDQRIVDTLGKQGTLKLVEEAWLWKYLLKTLP
ncbi:MAG: phospholipase D-like domain-containing protein [Candidatus Bathyarchaeia archaeon]|jgi:HKD family nuclease